MSESDVIAIAKRLERIESQGDRLGDKIDALVDTVNKANERSARHSQRLSHAEAQIELSHSRISGVKKWLGAGLVAGVGALADKLWSVLQMSQHK